MKRREVELEQGSEEWREWRLDRACASEAGIIMGVAPSWMEVSTWEDLRTVKRGGLENPPAQFILNHGIEREPAAVRLAEMLTNYRFRPAVFEAEFDDVDWVAGASIDGWDESASVACEVKAPYQGTKSRLWKGVNKPEPEIEDYIFWQLVHQAQVTMCERIRLLVYITDDVYWSDEWDGDDLREHWPDLFQQWCLFYSGMEQPDPERRTDRAWVEKASAFAAAERRYNAAKEAYDAAKKALIEAAKARIDGQPSISDESISRVYGGGALVRRVNRKGSIDYTQIPEVKMMSKEELEDYRRPGTTFYVAEAK